MPTVLHKIAIAEDLRHTMPKEVQDLMLDSEEKETE
jgi:hypothetical protein